MAYQRKQRLGVSIRKFADLAGVDESFVRARIRSGYLARLPDGSIDPALASGEWLPRNRRKVAQPERPWMLERFVLAVEDWREIVQPQFGETEEDHALTFEAACQSLDVDAETLLTWIRGGMPYLKTGDWESGNGFLLSHHFMVDWLTTVDFTVTIFKDAEAARILRITPGFSDRFNYRG